MLTLIKRNGWWFAGVTAVAVLLRLFFVWKLPVVTDDSVFYGDIAKSILHGHGIAIQQASGWQPTLSRLPGYPLFLAFSFRIGGEGSYVPAMLLQLIFDVLTCYLVGDIARRIFGERAARWGFLLAALCPFLMNYVAAPLTECLEVFCTAAALDCALIALARPALGRVKPRCRPQAPGLRWWLCCGVSCAGAILLRPDGGLILVGIGLPVLAMAVRGEDGTLPGRRRELFAGIVLMGAVALAPLAPWTARNWRVFHVFQPLVNTHASDPGDFVPVGWERWLQSWVIDYASVEDVAFQVEGSAIDPANIPSRAYDSEAQRARVLELVDKYNERCRMTPELDRQFAGIAAENRRSHPVRYYVLLPLARTVDMWMRPRSELMPLDTHFWRISSDPHDALCDLALGALNLGYVAAAVAGVWVMRRRVKYLGLLLTYPVVRSLFLATTGQCEDRYTLECLPFVFVLAAGFLGWWQTRAKGRVELRAEQS